MRVIQSCLGKFHHFHLARQLHRRGDLVCIFTGYPWFKLKNEGIPRKMVRTFPWLHGMRMGGGRFGLKSPYLIRELEQWSHRAHDRFTCRNLPACDVFVGLSGTALETGKKAKSRGAIYVCDRGSSHIRFQSRIMNEERTVWGISHRFEELVDPRTVLREESEYETADFITVPSEFTRRSFIAEGISAEKVIKIPYGADVSRFHRVASPPDDTFTVLFVGRVSFRKGALYLIDAFNQLPIRNKKLIFVGTVSAVIEPFLHQRKLDQVSFLGQVPHGELREYYSRAHVLALPSVEEGLACVMGEAMACGCPVIATENTGAEDLFENEREGFILPPRDVQSLTQRLQQIFEDPSLRASMSASAIDRTRSIGGWDSYGDKFLSFLHQHVKTQI
jgi:glycosyltransferase involved in cell wall biosynthesis